MQTRLKYLAAALSAFPLIAVAAEQATSLNPVVVTAARQEQRINEVLADMTVIDAEEIRKAGPGMSINELLSMQPGIELTLRGGLGTDSGVMIRGGENKHALVLVDGMRLGSATLGTPAWGFIPLEQVERIEVLRGSCSSLYGSDAIGGVIQIFTKRGEGAFQPFAEVGGGSWHTKTWGVGFSGASDAWRYSFQLSDKRADGYSAIYNPKNSSYNSDRDGYAITSSSGSLSYRISSDHEVGVSYLYAEGMNRYDSSPKSAAWRQEETLYGATLYSKNRLTTDWLSTLRLGTSADDGWQYKNGVKNSSIRTDQYLYQWQNDIKLGVGSALLAVERLEQFVSGTVNYAEDKRHIDSVMVGWTGQIDSHRFQVNARRDDSSQFGAKNTGLAAYGYKFSPNWRANVSYASAFKAPTFNDMYWPVAGNPDLKPETAKNKEASLHYETGSQHVSLTYFRNDIKDMVAWAPGSSGLWLPSNVNKARIEGVTLAYQGEIAGYRLGASVDLQDPKDRVLDKQLRYRSKESAKLNVSKDVGNNWTLGGELLLAGQRYNDVKNTVPLDGYALLNLHASYRFEKDWSVFARLNNAFDRDYVLVNDYATPGRNFFLGVRYSPK